MAVAGEAGSAKGFVENNPQAGDERVNIRLATIVVDNPVYTGEPVQPKVTVSFGGKTLVPGTDYDLAYAHNVGPGMAFVSITGKGAYADATAVPFSITKPITVAAVVAVPKQQWVGLPVTPGVTVVEGAQVLTEGSDYLLSYKDNVDPGTAAVIITGTGAYSGAMLTTFTIEKSISQVSLAPIEPQAWTGKAVTPEVVLVDKGGALVPDVDYTLSYANNVASGNAEVTIEGKGIYTGKTTATFVICKDISAASIAPITAQSWTGRPLTPVVKVADGPTTLLADVDYTLSYAENVEPGRATVLVTGTGKYAGSCSATFAIVKDLAKVTVAPIPAQAWTGKAVMPKLAVTDGTRTLKEGGDFSVAFENNVDSGTAKATLRGIGDYSGSTSANFTICKDLSLVSVDKLADQRWTGLAIKPEVSVKDGAATLAEGRDYTLSYGGNVNPGEGKVVLQGIGRYAGTKELSFSIIKDLSTLSLSPISLQEWTGEGVEPKPMLMDGGTSLVEGRDYTLSYANNVEPGTATVVATGKGFYLGTLSATFTIGEKSGQWGKEDGKWTFRYRDGSHLVSSFIDEGGARYYFDENGQMATGWKKINSSWYFFRSDGKMGAKDWVESEGKRFYLGKDGKVATNQWVQYEGAWYWFDATGTMATGWSQIKGRWFFFEDSGTMATGWKEVNGNRFFLQPQEGDDLGVMLVDTWIDEGGNKYYVGETGTMVLGWKRIAGKWYYFDSEGVMVTNRWVGNYWLGPEGHMLTNQWVDDCKYYVGEDGAWKPSAVDPS